MKTEDEDAWWGNGHLHLVYTCAICTAAEPFAIAGLKFDQSKMRQHLLKCFQRENMMPFPQTKAGPNYQTYRYFPCMDIELICTCQMPETHDDMVECDTCGDWYHRKCVGLEQFPPENGEHLNTLATVVQCLQQYDF